MRHEITKRCITLGSALAMGLAALTASSQAQQADAEPKQKPLISFKMDFLSRFKKEETTAETAPAKASPEVVPASAIDPLPAGSAKTHAVPATNMQPAQPLPPTSLTMSPNAALPPSVSSVQLASGQFPLPAATGQMPFQTAQSPVVVMMPAGWQPDGNYTFAPRTVLSPEVPAEHWPTSRRNPLGDDSRKGLFDWPQIAKKITNSTIGEPEIKPRPATAPEQSNSRALFATAGTHPTSAASHPLPPAAQSAPVETQATPVAPQQMTAPAPVAQPTMQTAQAPDTHPTSKALFAPQPEQPEPQPEEPKTRALFSLLSKPMNKPVAAPPSAGSKALFAFGRKTEEPAVAPAPAVVPQYAAEAATSSHQNIETLAPAPTVESIDPELQPPAPPSVAHPLPGKLQTVKSDDPKMKWRAKGAPAQVIQRSAAATETPTEMQPEVITMPASEAIRSAGDQAVMAGARELPAVEPAAPAPMAEPPHKHVRHQAGPPTTAVSQERSLLGKHFLAVSATTPRSTNDARGPWRRQAERDATVAAEKRLDQPMANSKAILPNVAALFPPLEKANRSMQQYEQHEKPAVTTVAAIEDTGAQSTSVRRAHETSARSTNSYYAAPWEDEVEAELKALERRQIGAVSNRRAAVARETMEHDEESFEQPRVPFEVDDFEREKTAIRRNAKTKKPAPSAQPKSDTPTGSPSNGARMAEQHSQKNYRRLTGGDVKQSITRPLAMLGDMTKLPPPLQAAADNFERRQEEPEKQTTGDDVERYEFSDEQPRQTAPKRSAAKREPAHELRQSTAVASEESRQPSTLGQRGGRRQVERTARALRGQSEPQEQVEEDSAVVTVEDLANEEVVAEASVRPATHIRNKHGNRVTIFTGNASAGDSTAE